MRVVLTSAPLQGTVVAIQVAVGDLVPAGGAVVVLESMKMEHEVVAEVSGRITDVLVAVGESVATGQPLVSIDATVEADVQVERPQDVEQRTDLAGVLDRHERALDAARPDAVARRHDAGRRTARENLEALLDPGSFVEYGPLVVAAQRARRSHEELIERTPADGLVGGVGTIDGRGVVALSYDYTVLAGTQGIVGHAKKDRLFDIARRRRLPVIVFAEGGGGRPGDSDGSFVTGLDTTAFHDLAALSALVPLVGITGGFCFAGNAALLGCCDVVIALEGSNIGMGGPAMVEAGGLGAVAPDDIGPHDVQVANGVIDLSVPDDAAAVAVAKRYLAYFTRPQIDEWGCGDQRALRELVPENRVRAYDVRAVVDVLADEQSVLELRRGWGRGIVTALARIDGRALGIVANDPMQLGGAIDVDAADKSARFLQLCDAFDLPVLFLCDTPGFMVGPEHEARAAVRHLSRLFLVGANLTVPTGMIVLRKAYGLGAQAMAAGSFRSPLFCVAWPTGELGGMNLEGAVRLGYRTELDGIADAEQRQRRFDELLRSARADAGALNVAEHFELDDVIDPAASRRWIARLLTSEPTDRVGKKRPNIE